jgi:hypothetical protein
MQYLFIFLLSHLLKLFHQLFLDLWQIIWVSLQTQLCMDQLLPPSFLLAIWPQFLSGGKQVKSTKSTWKKKKHKNVLSLPKLDQSLILILKILI